MAKKGAKSKRASAAASDAYSDTSSLTGDRSRRYDSDASDEINDPWEAAWDQIMDGNSAMRAQGITRVCNLLRSTWQPDYVEDSKDKFVDVACSALTSRKSDKREQEAAAHMLALLFITLGRDYDGFFGSLDAVLQKACREGKARPSAISAFALGSFCCEGSDADELSAVRFLAGLWLTSTGEALLAALRGWALLVSAMDVRLLTVPLIQATLRALSDLLAGKDVAVRGAAAEALGLLYRRCGLEVLQEGEEEEEWSDGEGDEAASVSGVSMSTASCAVSSSAREVLEAGFEAVFMRMTELAKSRGDKAKLNKHDKRSSKGVASEMLAVLSGEGVRVETFKLKSGARVDFSSLEARVHRDALRGALQGGFQLHMNHNPLLQEVFGHDADAAPQATGKGSAARWRSTHVKTTTHKQRERMRSAQQASHMMEDCDF